MSMFCYQCQETALNKGCTMRGVCGKPDTLCHLMDLTIYALKGLAWVSTKLNEYGKYHPEDSIYTMQALFRTITNANWSEDVFLALIPELLAKRDMRFAELDQLYREKHGKPCPIPPPEAVVFHVDPAGYQEFGIKVGVLRTETEDIRSLRETIIYGVKGISAYGEHA